MRPPRYEGDNAHFAGAGRALLRVGDAVQQCCVRRARSDARKSVRDCTRMRRPGSCGFQVRSEGSVFFAGVRISGDNCAKIHVKVSLAQTGRWLRSFGLLADGQQAPEVSLDDVRDCVASVQSEFGRVLGVLPAEELEQTPAFYALPPARIGAHEARWT